MSPLLFGVYMDGLLDELEDFGIGCYIGQHFCGAAYADDIILLCPTSSGLRKMIEVCEKYAKLQDVLLNGSKSKLIVYNKKDADPHFEINGTDVSTCEQTLHLGNVLSTTDKNEMLFDGIKKSNCSVNRLMSVFGSLQTVVKTYCFIGIVVHCTDLNYGHCGMTVLIRCAYCGVWFAQIFNTINC